MRLIGHEHIPGPPSPLQVPPWQNVPARLTSALGWREIAGALVHLIFGILTFTLWIFGLTLAMTLILAPFLPLVGRAFAIGNWQIDSPVGTMLIAMLGLVVLAVFLYAQLLLALGQAMTTRVLIGSRVEELQQQVTTLAGERVALIDAFEAERRRIERDLHDGPQQHLAGAALHLGLLRTRLQARAPEDQAELLPNIDAAHDEIERALDTIRDAVAGLRPRILIDKGLLAAIDDLAERSPIPVIVSISRPVRLHEAVEASVYSIATEFVANSLKHSGATQITITLDTYPDGVRLVLNDNGCGGADPAQGSGLIGIQHRATLLHGVIELHSPAGGPTTLSLLLPEGTIRTGASA
ncbi:putative two-component system sensor kinase [Microbacterium esteraromaticum]|uniref:histidine kinase n=1 Tax=Microbacterium esteraromaticum TaxID=57043 RepID=A0A1R4I7L4_9MICO|nr:putative two-component system sensor kinase [Microbacterium esteraromaticum]